jgi:group I intron endonuclease
MTGIYAIVSKRQQAIYIGQTSRAFNARWDEHKADLVSGTHCNYKLMRHYGLYGLSDFRWVVLETCHPRNLNEREGYWMTKYRYKGYTLWNVAPAHTGGYTPRKPRKSQKPRKLFRLPRLPKPMVALWRLVRWIWDRL